jgi:hypothetical protein
MIRPRPAAALVVALALLLLACGGCSVNIAPVVASDPQTPCPGGSPEWTLQIVDQRAEKKAVPNVEGPIRDSVLKSLPGCRWAASGAPTITIEVHRFSAVLDEVWEAHAEWSVLVRDRDGRTLTEFQADAQVTRPNYRGSDNEKAALQHALDEAMHRTLAGIRAVSPPG